MRLQAGQRITVVFKSTMTVFNGTVVNDVPDALANDAHWQLRCDVGQDEPRYYTMHGWQLREEMIRIHE